MEGGRPPSVALHPGPVRDRIVEIQQAWTARDQELIRDAQAAGSLSTDEDPAQLAFELDAYGMMGNTG
jgi:hypothetical protein